MQTIETICLLLDSRGIGGIETHVLQLALGLEQAGKTVQIVFVEDHGPHPLRAALAERRIDTLSLDGSLRALRGFLRAARPDIVHSHGYRAGLMGRLAVRSSGCVHVSTYHAGETCRGRLALYDWLDRRTAWLNSRSLAVSARIAGRVGGGCHVMDNFIAIPPRFEAPGSRIAFVGRLSREKGPDYLLRLAGRLRRVRFDIYGSGPLEAELRARATDNCVFHGNQPDMDPHWAQIGLLLMPSRYEGLPMAALEAMAREIPVVGFDVGALGRVVQNGLNGWLAEPGDLDGLQDRLQHWLTLAPVQKRALSRAARHLVQHHFSTAARIPEVLAHYRAAAGGAIPFTPNQTTTGD